MATGCGMSPTSGPTNASLGQYSQQTGVTYDGWGFSSASFLLSLPRPGVPSANTMASHNLTSFACHNDVQHCLRDLLALVDCVRLSRVCKELYRTWYPKVWEQNEVKLDMLYWVQQREDGQQDIVRSCAAVYPGSMLTLSSGGSTRSRRSLYLHSASYSPPDGVRPVLGYACAADRYGPPLYRR